MHGSPFERGIRQELLRKLGMHRGREGKNGERGEKEREEENMRK